MPKLIEQGLTSARTRYMLFGREFYRSKDQTNSIKVLMSRITDDGLSRSGTVCFIAVPIWHQWASKG